jgi:hypothetical protein
LATEDQHLSQFEHNQAVAQRLALSTDFDWAMTALFYAGLHLMQAYLVRIGVTAETHIQRERQILMIPELSPLMDAYRMLRDHSEDARYECRAFSREEFEAIRGGTFASVVTHVQSLLGVR